MTHRTASKLSPHLPLLAVLFLAALAAALTEAFFIRRPGTMDACYYYGGGWNLVRGLGWSEYFLWNYLDGSAVLPHPGNMYWMPLPSLLAAAGMAAAGAGFRQAQILPMILAVGFPFLVYGIGKQLTGSFRIAILAGFLSIASGFYVVYWMNTESFLVYAWIGGLILFFSQRMSAGNRWTDTLFIGVLCGLAHLTRADGILFLVLAVLMLLFDRSLTWPGRLGRLAALAAGYLMISGAWYARNLSVWGSLLPPGTSSAAWLTEYNDLFHFPSSDITAERFLADGLSPILQARWDALLSNGMTLIFAVGLVFLFPLVGWGVSLLRRKAPIRLALAYLLMIFLLMSIVYPFQGSRGGFLHSAAAVLPFVCLAASAGLDDVLDRLIRLRKWDPVSAKNILGSGIAGLAFITSGVIFSQRVVGADPQNPEWARGSAEYNLGVARLGDGVPADAVIMVNNPPCFYVQTSLPAVPVTAGDETMLLAAADRFGVRYVILDANAPNGLQSLYLGETANPRLRKLFADEYDGMLYVWFEVLPP
jgi:4-amino-4-deoxy-L-arabinose transferase-like glycosyltransferase